LEISRAIYLPETKAEGELWRDRPAEDILGTKGFKGFSLSTRSLALLRCNHPRNLAKYLSGINRPIAKLGDRDKSVHKYTRITPFAPSMTISAKPS
jgi:hypothetical protein